jgi:hypothetical protein
MLDALTDPTSGHRLEGQGLEHEHIELDIIRLLDLFGWGPIP